MKTNIVKNQHYISQFILKNFANDKNQVYEFLVKASKIYPINFSQSMSEKFAYEHSLLDQNTLEKIFSKLEGQIAPLFNKLIEKINTVNSGENITEITPLIEEILLGFLIFYYRSGALLTEFESDIGNQRHADRIMKLLEKITDSYYLNELKNTISSHYDISIIKSEHGDFLLSDQFISTAALSVKSKFLNISNRHMGLKDVLILIPISKNFYIAYFNGKKPIWLEKNKLCELTEVQIKEINKVIINNSYNKCISNKKDRLNDILEHYDRLFPSESFAKFQDGKVLNATVKKEVFFYENDKNINQNFIFIYQKYKNIKRNDICICGKNSKFKKCCMQDFQESKRIMDHFRLNQNDNVFRVHHNSVVEKSVSEFFTSEEPDFIKKLNKTNRA